MKRIIALSVFLSLLFINPLVGNQAVAKSQPVKALSIQVGAKALDPRAQILKDYLAGYDSPLQYHAQDFIDAADKYKIDWKLVPAISGVESTFGKNTPGGFNGWGWGVYGNQALYFGSWRDGIFTVSQGLRENYFNKGLSNPYEINRVYAASPVWGAHVSYFLNDLNQFAQKYQGATQSASLEPLDQEVKTAGSSANLSYGI